MTFFWFFLGIAAVAAGIYYIKHTSPNAAPCSCHAACETTAHTAVTQNTAPQAQGETC